MASTGLLLNKFEIFVGFLQVYALTIALSLHLDFPDLWLDIKIPYDWLPNIGMIDFYSIFARLDLSIPDEYVQVCVLLRSCTPVQYPELTRVVRYFTWGST